MKKFALIAVIFVGLMTEPAARAAQDGLVADTGIHDPVLTFDWPDIEIGVGAYEEGPTGLTIIRFMHRAAVVVDSRGGAPGTVNTDALRLGYDAPRMDAVVFAGGSAYGEEAVTAVMTGLKDDGLRSGAWDNIAHATGAIIYDFGPRRLNEIYPDKRLAQAALHALRPGVFPLGAQGAGRMAMQGGFFGCPTHSGEGAAFREFNGVKIAAFVVVNASGSITDRKGNVVKCDRIPPNGSTRKIADLMTNVPLSHLSGWEASPAADVPTHRNTTVSLIVTNARLDYAGLRRLAIQVHTSMARAIQPFSTFNDGDTLFAATTDDVPVSSIGSLNLDTMAGEIMWDAILASVPQEPAFSPPKGVVVSEDQLRTYAGTYAFAPHVRLRVDVSGGNLSVTALDRTVFDFPLGSATHLMPASTTEFYYDLGQRTRLSFTAGADGTVTGVILDPGPWAQRGKRIPD
ncbi:MAG TPA: P1 family peptidase [Acetobacteraceae bacterium]|nr:P1 family peptidase [Acetobacteraceae bacterium]